VRALAIAASPRSDEYCGSWRSTFVSIRDRKNEATEAM
jgi:hypothetical protein